MTRSISLLSVALALSLGTAAAQAQDTANKAAAPAAKAAAAAKAASKAAPVTVAKDPMGRSAPSQSNASKSLAPVGTYPQSSPKDGSSGCHSKDSDA
jgi:hypothetical protein